MKTARLISGIALAFSAWADLQVQFPADGPLVAVAIDSSGSRVSTMGGALVIDVRAGLQIKNTSGQGIRAVTLLVTAEELTAGGKASVTVPSLDVRPGETFPIRVDLRLLRPRAGMNAPVRVALDGVLFDTLGFYGPNKLNSRRAMLAWELEARRDRKYFADLLDAKGGEGLRREIVASLARQDGAPRLDVQVSRGRVTNAEPTRDLALAALNTPGAPVEVLGGMASVADREVRLPRLDLRSRAEKEIRFIEIGWLAKTGDLERRAGSLPATVSLQPGDRKSLEEQVAMRFPMAVDRLAGFVSSVEYADGSVWIPPRDAARGVSPEEQRLSDLYRRKGIEALITELKKFR